MSSFLTNPGQPGPVGAILDETARAAEDLCRVVEAKSPEEFTEKREGSNPGTVSIQAISAHCVNWGYAYSNYIRAALGEEQEPVKIRANTLRTPADLREQLRPMFRHTEATLEMMASMPLSKVQKLEFQVSWGVTYNPEGILEHGIVHLLRHRRQIERW